MRHIQSLLIGSVIALMVAANARSAVIYKWHSTSPGSYVTATGGELVFTNAAYFSGSAYFYVNDWYDGIGTSPWVQLENCGDLNTCQITNNPVISAHLEFGINDGDWAPGIYAQPGAPGFYPQGFPFFSNLTFNDDGTLSGDLFLYDISDEANADGMHYSWTVSDYGSDYFGDQECGPPTCYGGTGYWQLSSVTPVPEPPVWPLFGIGVLGLLGLRRRA